VDFVGRKRELRALDALLDEVRSSGDGRMVAVRGRRQVGKSTLVERFCERSGAPVVFFAASRRSPGLVELERFAATAAASLGAPQLDASFRGWDAALTAVAATADEARPVIVVLDEFPWLIEEDPSIEGVLQTVWDRRLRRSPVLVVLIGSDLAMMDALAEYGRPLYDRLRIMRVDPLAPSEVAVLTSLDPVSAIDVYLAVGGFPNQVQLAARHGGLASLLRTELRDPTSPLIVAGERSITAEFPPQVGAHAVLAAVGSGAREHNAIRTRSGVSEAALNRALGTLVTKRVVTRRRPYSTDSAIRRTRYEVVDPYLRFWLAWLGPNLPEVERGRGGEVARRILSGWSTYRGIAVESIVREALTRLLPDKERFGPALHVGSYWTRDGRVEVDLVAGDKEPVASRLGLLGSIKWRERAQFSGTDVRALEEQASRIPGGDGVPLVGVSPNGATEAAARSLSVVLGAEDILTAW
jgi:AAA+ ATPase superfamily predicted ATPase